MAEKMNGFNFGTTMKKIFFAIIALAALVGCNTNVMEEVATTPAYLTTSFEVALNGDTRAFDNELNWNWESTDEIAAFQFAGDCTLNKLTMKDNGKFGTEEFKYATAEPSTFVFVYPFAAYDAESQDVGYVQTGEWTPTLVGIVENATVNNIGTVEMNHMSAAFEIRVWDEGRAARKTISAATITSESDFCDDTTATVEGLNTDTVVFNIAEGDFAFNLTLTATDDATYTVAVPTKNFVNGKRTILNVEWKYPKPVVSFNVLSSYTNKDNSLDGRSIYVKDVVLTNADSATIALYLNGNKAADLTPGKTTTVSNLALGEYKAVVKWTVNGKEYTSGETKVYVTGIPYTLNPAANDSWNAWKEEGYVTWNKDSAVRLGYNVESWLSAASTSIEKTFFVPFDTNVVVNSTGSVCGSGSKSWLGDSRVNTTFTLYVSGSTAYSVKSTDGGNAQSYSSGDKHVSMSASNATVKLHNSYSTASGRTSVKTLTIKY